MTSTDWHTKTYDAWNADQSIGVQSGYDQVLTNIYLAPAALQHGDKGLAGELQRIIHIAQQKSLHGLRQQVEEHHETAGTTPSAEVLDSMRLPTKEAIYELEQNELRRPRS